MQAGGWDKHVLQSSHQFQIMKSLVFVLLCLPTCLMAELKLLVDEIPSDATFAGSRPFGLPFKDAGSQDFKTMQAGISSAVSGFLKVAEKQDFSYVCLLSIPGENPVEISVPKSTKKLKLRRTKTSIVVVFYKGGSTPPKPVTFSAGHVTVGQPQVSMQIEKVPLPSASTPADWIYLHLPRIQSEAVKGGAAVAMLQLKGEGPFAEVAVPGLKNPLLVPEGRATLTASWYIDDIAEKPMRQPEPEVLSL